MASPTTVLVVDDESSLRRLVARRLTTEGYRVLEAGDGIEALALLQKPESDIRLVITDIRMPRMDGYALADRIGERAKSPPIIFISGYGQAGVWLPGSVFAKPFSLDALMEEVRRLLSTGKQGPNPPVRRRAAPT
jgi:CheY-like chemotaxis protein